MSCCESVCMLRMCECVAVCLRVWWWWWLCWYKHFNEITWRTLFPCLSHNRNDGSYTCLLKSLNATNLTECGRSRNTPCHTFSRTYTYCKHRRTKYNEHDSIVDNNNKHTVWISLAIFACSLSACHHWYLYILILIHTDTQRTHDMYTYILRSFFFLCFALLCFAAVEIGYSVRAYTPLYVWVCVHKWNK